MRQQLKDAAAKAEAYKATVDFYYKSMMGGEMYQGEVREMTKREYEEQKNKAYRTMVDNCVGKEGPMLGTGCSPRTPEVTEALGDLQMAIERYDGLVGRLGSKLYPVLRPAEPSVADPRPDRVYHTNLAQEINGTRCLARDISDTLESIIERLEV